MEETYEISPRNLATKEQLIFFRKKKCSSPKCRSRVKAMVEDNMGRQPILFFCRKHYERFRLKVELQIKRQKEKLFVEKSS